MSNQGTCLEVDSSTDRVPTAVRSVKRWWLAIRWLLVTSVRYFWLRERIAKHMGRQWLRDELPMIAPNQLLQTSGRVLVTALRPRIHQAATRRSERMQRILNQLQSLNRSAYPITTAPGQKVFIAALARCMSAICEQPVRHNSLAAMLGPPSSNPTGIAMFLVNWLEERMAGGRRMWTTPLPSCSTHISNADARATATNSQESRVPVKVHFQLDQASIYNGPAVSQTRAQSIAEQEQLALDIADQELLCVLAEQELQMLAIPMAVLEALRRRKPK